MPMTIAMGPRLPGNMIIGSITDPNNTIAHSRASFRECLLPSRSPLSISTPLPQIQRLKKVIPLVVDDDEGGEVFYVDAPDRFHAQVFEFDALDLGDAVLGQAGAGAAYGAEIEATVLGARVSVTRALCFRRPLPRVSLERIG